MGDISRIKKSYAYISIDDRDDLPAGWVLAIDGREWDFEEFAKWGGREDLAYVFSVVFWQSRFANTNDTRDHHWALLKYFWTFLDVVYPDLTRPSELSPEVVVAYRSWLSHQLLRANTGAGKTGIDTLSFNTQRKAYGLLSSYLRSLMVLGIVASDFRIPGGDFRNLYLNTNKAKPYSQAERARIVRACKNEFETIEAGGIRSEAAKLFPYIIIFALRTGVNRQPLLDLRIDSLSPSVLPGRYQVTLYKNRGYSAQRIGFDSDEEEIEGRLSITKRVAKLVEDVIEQTRELRAEAPEAIKDYLWLIRRCDDSIGRYTEDDLSNATHRFIKVYNLVDDYGEPLKLNVRRMRPTFAHALLRINGGDLRDLQRRLNHKFLQTTMDYLDPDQEEFESSFKHRGLVMVRWLKGKDAEENPVKLAAELGCTAQEAKAILDGDNDMSVGKCRNPEDSPFNEDGPCTRFMACFRCPNQIITKDDSHKIFSFYWFLLNKKAQIPAKAWQKAYAWIIRIIDEEVAPKLGSPDEIEAIKCKAKSDPHPAWPNTQIALETMGVDA